MKQQIIGGALALADGRVLPLSKAVRAGDFVFLSGQLGLTADGTLAGTDIETQTRQSLENIKAILSEAGCSFAQIGRAHV